MGIFAISFLGLGFFGGYLIWGTATVAVSETINPTPRISSTDYPTSTPAYIVNPSPTPTTLYQTPNCNKEECLFKSAEEYVGYAKLKGYYQPYDGTKWEWGNKQVTCDSLLVTSGSEILINRFKEFIQHGNSLNKLIDNNLHVNIHLAELSFEEKRLLQQSNATNQVELAVIRRWEEGRGASSTCYSLIDIISVTTVK